MTPSRIGRYEVQRRLGRGGMGSLYLGYDPKLKRPVAIKLLNEDVRDNSELRDRFAREAESLARLRHPNIVVVFDVGEDESGQPFMAMEYIAGETLKRTLQPPSIPLPKRLALIEDLCAGLAHAHAAGIIHRDIKPENVMLDGDGVVKIVDFGIARQANSGMTTDGMMLGTYNYMSPEQMTGRPVDNRSDIFAVGAVLYEVIALKKAFPGDFPETYHRILTTGPLPLETLVPGVDPELTRIVRRALESEPERRYQDMSAMRQEIVSARRRISLSESGTQTAYGATRVRPVPPDRQEARRPADNKRLAEIRRQQVDEQLELARAAVERGDHDAVLQHAERAASVDPENRVAFDLIDKARLAIDTKVVLKLLRDATRLLDEGLVDEAADLARQASSAVPDVPGADVLRQEVQYVLDSVREAWERETRIQSSLRRARNLVEQGGYDSALRAIYEALALDLNHREARELEEVTKGHLEAQRERERLTREAYDRLKAARALADEGQFDQALEAIGEVAPPSATVRQAIADALGDVKRRQHEAEVRTAVAAAADALAHGHPEAAIERIDAIEAADQSDHSRGIRSAAAAEIERRRELVRKTELLEQALAAARACLAQSDTRGAESRIDDAAALGLEDDRIDVMRRELAELKAALEAKRREEGLARLAAAKVEEAKRQQADGDLDAAIALLEGDTSGRDVVRVALIELRAEREERLRLEAKRRQEEEERRRQEEERRRLEEERRRQDEARRQREEEETRKREEEKRRAEEEAERRRIEAEQIRQAEEALERQQEEARKRQEEEARKRAELEAARRLEEQRRAEQEKARVEAEKKARAEAERKAKAEAERKARDEAERKAREEAEQKAKVEAERRRRDEAARRRRDEEERRRREEARLEEQRREEQRRREEEERAERDAAVTQVRPAPMIEEEPQTISRPFEEAQTISRPIEAPAVAEIRTPPPAPVPRPVTPPKRPSTALIAAAASVVLIGIGTGAYYLLRAPVEIETRLTTSVPITTPATVPPTVPAQVTSINGVSTAATSAPTTIPRVTTQSTIAPQPSTVVTSTPATIAPTTIPLTSAPVTSVLTSAPTSAPTTSIPVRVQVDPKDAVTQVLAQYAAAYTARDFQALRRVWPAAPAAVNSTFGSVQRYELVLDSCDIRIVSADRAEAGCVARTTVVPERGSQTQRSSAARVIVLRQREGVWIIENVASR